MGWKRLSSQASKGKWAGEQRGSEKEIVLGEYKWELSSRILFKDDA